MEVERRHISNRLTMHRKLMRYSQKQVATLLGVDVSHVSRWENGVTMPSSSTLIDLSIIYRTLPNELYSEYYQERKTHLKAKEWELFSNQG